jgi:hypothetical protein
MPWYLMVFTFGACCMMLTILMMLWDFHSDDIRRVFTFAVVVTMFGLIACCACEYGKVSQSRDVPISDITHPLNPANPISPLNPANPASPLFPQ